MRTIVRKDAVFQYIFTLFHPQILFLQPLLHFSPEPFNLLY